jgi:antitoxin (DNA-binding transcriptional repressor) of toxin-antitoxin stability system
MYTSTIDEAQSQLPKLIVMAEHGEDVVIAREGKPVARLVALPQETGVRQGGQWHGRVRLAADFDELPSDIGEAFGIPPQ